VDAHQISPGQLIKIPLEWIRPEYLHQVPSIYRISKKTTSTEKVSLPEHQPSIENGLKPGAITGHRSSANARKL